MWVQHVGPPGYYHPWWAVLGGILPLLLLAVLIGLVVWAALRLTRESSLHGGPQWVGPAQRGPDAALEHLRYRYARGEVGRDEFFRMSQDLGAPISMPPPPPVPMAEEPGS